MACVCSLLSGTLAGDHWKAGDNTAAGGWNHLEASSLVHLEPGLECLKGEACPLEPLHVTSPCDSAFLTSHGGPASPRDLMGLHGHRPT